MTIEIDLSETQEASELIRELLLNLRIKHDLQRYEYTSHVRIAPGEIPHSHPVLTLNTRVREEAPLLSTYLHEQMHWYVTWYSYAQQENWGEIWKTLMSSYPDIPTTFPEGAHTAESSYLHLIVNWLEISAVSRFLGTNTAITVASKNFVYSGLYQIVLRDWETLSQLYSHHGLTPIRAATEMRAPDLVLAARMNEKSAS